MSQLVGPVRRSRHRAKQAPGAGCPLPGGAALAPAYVSVTFVAVRRPGKAQPPPGKTSAPGTGCSLPGGAALAPAYLSVTFVAARKPGKAQPPPGKNRRPAPDAHCRAALRLRRPSFRDICRSS
ncbi:hypothetical protein IE992_02360 [Klebsiella pneumoniae]|uniref:Uncharacterized protein n=1 Tax=Klebsiella pneumoniae TaxID=573 RepID=A0A927DZT6_KLEPN|nr:hypothetical protein [Klebsiella pneumoniae]